MGGSAATNITEFAQYSTSLNKGKSMAQGSYAFGGTAPGFTLGEILLYRLQITVSTWACTYLSNSGSYTSYSTIDAFIAGLKSGTLPPPDGPLPTFGPGESAPDLIVRMPCYVVIILSSSDQPSICFQSTALTTGTDCSSQYFALTLISVDSPVKQAVAYFAVPVVQPASKGVDDPYTMFVKYIANGSVVTHSIDPTICNHGPG
jgi:hypothetical protein